LRSPPALPRILDLVAVCGIALSRVVVRVRNGWQWTDPDSVAKGNENGNNETRVVVMEKKFQLNETMVAETQFTPSITGLDSRNQELPFF
jgi:hypothetical protein